ncbi:amidase [Nonomuraea sp. NPDC050153]|uniref:amidase n=1 Tax=Nonomuraea sp. NPDC050153 TaxID=3364359 RepID=UPI00379CB3F0
MTDLAYLSAVETLRLFRAGELSPVELLDAVVDRAERIQPSVNAFCEELYDSAREQARTAETRYAAGRARALEGLPVAIKEEQPIAGRTHEQGSLLGRGQIADVTHPVVARILDAGGVVHARTTTPEFSCAGFTHSELWGVTRNPWNTRYSSGGSSGGSAAALAAGMTTLATGSDIGGSIRIPASFCGVVGFKPPYGRVPALPPFNLDHYCHDGPLARTVGDCALLQNVIVGAWPGDVVSLRDNPVLPVTDFASVAGRRIAFSLRLGDFIVDPEIVANTYAVVEALRAAGAVVEEVELPWTRAEIARAADAHFGAIFGALVGSIGEPEAELLTPYARAFMARRAELSFYDGLSAEGRLYAPLGELLARYDALICPTAGIPAFEAGEDYLDRKLTIGGIELKHYMEGVLTLPFNIASRCPVLAVPSGRASTGVPTGVQIVGRTYDDLTVFEIAAALERERPWLTDPVAGGHMPVRG